MVIENMRRKFNKSFLLGLVPLVATTAIPSAALSACSKNKHNNKSESTSPQELKELPKDYTTKQYEEVMNNYVASVKKMNNDQIISEIDKVKEKLKQVNKECYALYESDELKQVATKEITELNKEDCRKFYNTFVKHVSKHFWPSCENFIQFATEYRSGQGVEHYDYAMHFIAEMFAVVQGEFLIQQLIVLSTQYTDTNKDENKWPEQQKSQIANLIYELALWCNVHSSLLHAQIDFMNPDSTIAIANADFLKKTKGFENFFGNFVKPEDNTNCYIKWGKYKISNTTGPVGSSTWSDFYYYKPNVYKVTLWIPFVSLDVKSVEIHEI